jgi:hypothetical protein
LYNAPLTIRVKRWSGRSSDYGGKELDGDGNEVFQFDRELCKAAEKIIEAPELLTAELEDWLCSPQAQKSHFFWIWLGKLDLNRHLLARVESLGATEKGASAFSNYFWGMSRVSPSSARARLFELIEQGEAVNGAALVTALSSLDADSTVVDNVIKLIGEGRVDPVFVERTLMLGKWAEPLTLDDFLRLLQAIQGGQLDNTPAALDFLGMWLHMAKPLEGDLADFAWGCLELLPPVASSQAYDCDQVASALAPSNPGRALALLDALVRQPFGSPCWYPIEPRTQHSFWDVLCSTDRPRALTIVVAAATDPLLEMRLTDDLSELVDPQGDSDVLIDLARQGTSKARIICQIVSLDKAGFWHVVFELLRLYPDNEEVKGHLSSTIWYGKRIIEGPMSGHLARRAEQVEGALADENTPAISREWLSDLLSGLRNAAERERVSEADWEVNR